MTHPAPSPLETTTQYLQGLQQSDTDVAGLLRAETQATEPWVQLGIVAMMVVLLLILAKNADYLAYRIKDFFSSERKFSNVQQQTTSSETLTIIVPMLVGAVSLSLIGFDSFGAATGLLSTPWMPYLVVTGASLCWIVAKTVVYSLVNWVFFDHSHSRKWLSSYYFLTSLFLGLILPIAVIYLFTETTLNEVSICLFTLLILYELLLFFKMIANFQTKRYGILLIFLYFCTAEILPVLLAGHFVQTSTLLH